MQEYEVRAYILESFNGKAPKYRVIYGYWETDCDKILKTLEREYREIFIVERKVEDRKEESSLAGEISAILDEANKSGRLNTETIEQRLNINKAA